MPTFPQSAPALSIGFACLFVGCTGFIHEAIGAPVIEGEPVPTEARADGPPVRLADPPPGELDVERAEARFVTTTDLVRYVISPGCGSERNECHNSEDFPDLSTEGNLWNLVGLRCNQGLGERTEVDGFCEAVGDEVRLTGGDNDGFTATIGAVVIVTNTDEEFDHYELRIDRPVPASQTAGDFVIVRGGTPLPALGAGDSADTDGGGRWVRITDQGDIALAAAIRQGDENLDEVYGDGAGFLVSPGDARGSYLVQRLLGHGSERSRMPLSTNADNPTEVNPLLSHDEMYALMSWINCMEPGDGPYDAVRYRCPANAENRGEW